MSGGGSSGPTTSTVQNTNIPDYLQGPVQQMIGQAQALTAANNQYKPFQGQGLGGTQVAGMSPLQQQAMQRIQQMQPSQYLNQAGALAGMAGTNQFTGNNVNQYMSPYVQDVIKQQQLGAIEGYSRDLPQLGSAASRVGGLGGSREALLQSEANRNLQNQLQGMTATGLQNAYQNAQQQFNESNKQQLTAAQQLGQLGQQDYSQNAGILQAQMGAGAQEQQNLQNLYNAQYQNYQNSINQPYAQLSYLSELIRGGSPQSLGGQYTASAYQSPLNSAMLGASALTGSGGLGSLFGAGS
jgi:hypothetical protein